MAERIDKIEETAEGYRTASYEPTTEDQMFFDHGPESFLSEVGQILRIHSIRLHIYTAQPRVRMEFVGSKPEFTYTEPPIRISVAGRSYGECLRKIREQIRVWTGR